MKYGIIKFISKKICFNWTIFNYLINSLYALLEEKSKKLAEEYRGDNYRDFLAMVHHSYGRMLRNDLSLWVEESPIVQWFSKEYGLTHADDISAMIIIGLLFKDDHQLRNDMMKNNANICKEHWREMEKIYGNVEKI